MRPSATTFAALLALRKNGAATVAPVAAAAPSTVRRVGGVFVIFPPLRPLLPKEYSAKCRTDGNHVSVTVLDRHGLVKITLCDGSAGPHTIGPSPVDGEQ